MAMLAGPVLPALLKLALPTVVVLVVQTLVGVAETYFVSFLGTEALAGVSLVFPIFMLMQMARFGSRLGPGRAGFEIVFGMRRLQWRRVLRWITPACGEAGLSS